jgi:hypothetical protein
MLCAITSSLRGAWPKWFLIGVWGPVISLLSGGLFAASALHFPGGYDWRYDVMCRLGYSHVNPEGSVYWSWALGLICFGGLACCGHFRVRLQQVAPKLSAFAAVALGLGLLAGIVVALDGMVLPKLNLLMPKLHETTATITFAAIFFGLVGFWTAMILWLRAERCWSVWSCALVSLLVAVPMAGAMISQAYLFFVPNNLGWVGPEWAKMGVPVYLSFAFWEWLAIAGIYACLYIMAILLPAVPPAAAGCPAGQPSPPRAWDAV